MRLQRRIMFLVALVTAVFLLVSACGSGPSLTDANPGDKGGNKVGGTLTVRIQQELAMADPHRSNGAADFNILRHVFEGLVTLNDKIEVIPMLAEKWVVSAGGKTYTFHLRKGVLFHNGKEMKAADVKYSLDRFRTESPRKGDFSSVESVTVKDDYTVEVNLKAEDGTFLAAMANPYVVAIIPENAAPKGSALMELIGTGPFKWAEWLQGNRIVMERFPDYKPIDIPASGLGGKKEALVDKLVFRLIPETQSALAGLETGEVDFIYGYPPEDVDRVKGAASYDIIELPGTYAEVLYFDLNGPLMKDKRFRQAVLHAIDKAGLLEAVYWGRGEVTNSYVPKGTYWFTDNHAKTLYPHDLIKAKALLQETGYKNEPLQIYSGNPQQRRLALALQEQLKKAGIAAVVENMEFSKYNDYLVKGGYQILASSSPMRHDPELRYNFWHCQRSAFGFHYCNPEYDRLIDEAKLSPDPNHRKELYAQAELLLKKDAVHEPLFFRNNLYAVRKNVKGFVPNIYDWWQFHNVSVK